MAALNHAVMIPGLIIVVLLLWAWMPIALVVWCLRRASGARNDEELLESGHVPHPGFQKLSAAASASFTDINRDHDHSTRADVDPRRAGDMAHKHSFHDNRRDGQQWEDKYRRRDAQAEEDSSPGEQARERQPQPQRKDRRKKARGHREKREAEEQRRGRGRGKERAHGMSREGDGESLLAQPEALATRESGRSRRLMDESRGYPSQE